MELRFNIVSQSDEYVGDDAECYNQLVEKTAIGKEKRCTFFDFCAGIQHI